MHPEMSEQCTYHIKIISDYAKLSIGAMEINMDSELSFIYESIMSLMTNVVLDVFNDQLSQYMVQVIIGLLNTMLDS